MSGIGGIISLNGSPVSQADLEKMSSLQRHRGPDGEYTWKEGNAALFCQMMRVTPESEKEIQPCIHSEGFILVFDGRLDNREDLFSILGEKPGVFPGCPDTNLILAAYHEFYLEFPKYLDGDYAIALYHPSKMQLVLVRDCVGIRPLYYFFSPHVLVFSSDIKSILAHPLVPVEPENQLLASFFFGSVGIDGDGRTLFKGIYSVQPGCMKLFTGPKMTHKRYWDFDLNSRNKFGSVDAYFEGFKELFVRSVKNRTRSRKPVSLALSGGLDSSAIFCAAQEEYLQDPHSSAPIYPITCSSSDGTATDEQEYLSALEHKYGVTIYQCGFIPGSILYDSDRQVWNSETPFLDELWPNSVSIFESAREQGSRILLTGHWGDQVLVNQAYWVDLFRQGRWIKIMDHLKQFKWWCRDVGPAAFHNQFKYDMAQYGLPEFILFPIRKLRRKFRRRSFNHSFYSREFWAGAWTNISHRRRSLPGATAHSKSLYNIIRSQSHIRWMEVNNKIGVNYGVEKAFPFIDRNLLSYLLANPGDINCWQGAPKGILREGLGEFLPEKIKHRRWKADGSAVVNQGVFRESLKLREILDRNSMVVQKGYVREDGLQSALKSLEKKILSDNCEVSWTLSDLLGLEIWLKTFFAGKDLNQNQSY